ncbi:MAG: thioredoxin [Flavobacteriales bacterium]|nr:thioredoxin [Flavobacteriales bacterium]
MTLELTDQNFESLLKNNTQPVVIDFWAQWCAPCKMVSIAIDALAKDYNGKAIIGKVDVDENPQLSSKFGVRNMPTILYIKNGEVVDKQVGSTSKLVLEEKLKAIL